MGYRVVVVVDEDSLNEFRPDPKDPEGNLRKLEEIFLSLSTIGRTSCDLFPTFVESVPKEETTVWKFNGFHASPLSGKLVSAVIGHRGLASLTTLESDTRRLASLFNSVGAIQLVGYLRDGVGLESDNGVIRAVGLIESRKGGLPPLRVYNAWNQEDRLEETERYHLLWMDQGGNFSLSRAEAIEAIKAWIKDGTVPG